MNKLFLLKTEEISKIDDLLQIQIEKEEKAAYEALMLEAEKLSTFKKGDIVRAKVGGRSTDQAVMIVEVHYVSQPDLGEDYKLTAYSVLDKNARKWNLTHSEGLHSDAKPEEVKLIKKAD
jgi:hypothetical protein